MTKSSSLAPVGASPPRLPTGVVKSSPALTLLAWFTVALFLATLFLPGRLYADDRYWLELFTRYMALALFALSVDLIWGYTGLLSLGQGLYFGLGAYAAGYSLKLQAAALEAGRTLVPGPHMALPSFMEYCGVSQVP